MFWVVHPTGLKIAVAFDRLDFFKILHKFDQKALDQWIAIVDNSGGFVRLKIETKIGKISLNKFIKNMLCKWGQEAAKTISCITGENT